MYTISAGRDKLAETLLRGLSGGDGHTDEEVI
jgi:hypothetical protein